MKTKIKHTMILVASLLTASCVQHTSSTGSRTTALLGNVTTPEGLAINTDTATKTLGSVAKTGLWVNGIKSMFKRVEGVMATKDAGKTTRLADSNTTKVALDGNNVERLRITTDAELEELKHLNPLPAE